MAHTYRKIDHFKHMLDKYQGKNSDVPSEVIDEIRRYISDNKIRHVNAETIRAILKENGLSRYFQDVPFILLALKSAEECKQPYDVKPENFECPVCLESETVINVKKLECAHIFCHSCVSKMIVDNGIRCPLCRNQQTSATLNISPESIRITTVPQLDKTQENEIIKMAEHYIEEYEKFNSGNTRGNLLNMNNLIKDLIRQTIRK